MKIGLVFPQTEIGADPRAIADYAQAADDIGFSHLLAFDHVLGAAPVDRQPPLWGPYTHEHSFHEPLTLFSFLSGITSRIAFTTGVLVLPQRQTALVAKQAAEVALLSSGRFRLGIGVGWNHVEYDALNMDFSSRGLRQEDQVALLRELWSTEIVNYHSEWHRVDRAGIAPRPEVEIPIWFGGLSTVARERAARLGDGFLFAKVNIAPDQSSASSQVALGRELRANCRRVGRTEESFGLEGRIDYADGPTSWAEDLAMLEDERFDYVAVNMMNAGLVTPTDHLAAIELVASELGIS